MKKTEQNTLSFDHAEEVLVRISLDLKQELVGLSGEKYEEILLIILAINQGELIEFHQNTFGVYHYTLRMPDSSLLRIARSLSKMPFVKHDLIQDDARDWSIISHSAGSLQK